MHNSPYFVHHIVPLCCVTLIMIYLKKSDVDYVITVPVDVRILFFGRSSAKSFARRVSIAIGNPTNNAKQLVIFVRHYRHVIRYRGLQWDMVNNWNAPKGMKKIFNWGNLPHSLPLRSLLYFVFSITNYKMAKKRKRWKSETCVVDVITRLLRVMWRRHVIGHINVCRHFSGIKLSIFLE